jgi:chemotaxis protein MotB
MSESEESAGNVVSAFPRTDQKQQKSFQGYSKYVQEIDPIEEEVKLWLITITDVVALMLTFFVLTYAMSVPEEDKWNELSASLSSEFTKTFSKPYNAGPQDTISIDKLDLSRALGLPYLRGLIDQAYEKQEITDYVIAQQGDRLIVSLPNDIIVETASPERKAESRAALIALTDILARIKNRIEVVGHAPDPGPAPQGANADGWTSSLGQAAQIAAFLRANGYGKEMLVRGLSSARSEEGASASGRVDIVILRDNGLERELLMFEQP